jgi:MOSC domain-containing protein YiiM
MTYNTTTGKVLKLFITKNDAEKTRVSLDSAVVDENGIHGDKFYAKDTQRSVLITSIESYELAKKNNIDINNGILGENILIDINPYSLQTGDKLQIGDTLLQITQNCTLCKGLTAINSKLPKLLKNDRGIFAQAINGETRIKIGDSIKFLNN